jgi:hypothetical protein
MESMGGANVDENDSSGLDNLVDIWMADRDARQAVDDASTAEEKLFTKAGKTGYFDIRDAVGQPFSGSTRKATSITVSTARSPTETRNGSSGRTGPRRSSSRACRASGSSRNIRL